VDDVADVQIEKVEEVLAPVIDNTVSVVEGADEALRLSVLTMVSSESSDTHGEYIRTPSLFLPYVITNCCLTPFLFSSLVCRR
jgi:hypothetical protein